MDSVDVLQEELSRLENAVRHLRRSNTEMKEALASEGPDRDLKEAIEENIVTIAKYVADIDGIQQQLRDLRGGPLAVPHTEGGANGAAVPEQAPIAPMQEAEPPGGSTSQPEVPGDGEPVGGVESGGMWL
mmetsp:Transcript_26088/g.67434  ORF Transcript_26088/g.67434 Transcript_26088/m.67434 type:complete len:130 (+) Transcript_26088:404-793(+)